MSIPRSKTLILPKGFTLVELSITIGILILLLAIGLLNLAPSFGHTQVTTGVDVLLADLKSQQARAMAGEGSSDYGLYFESQRYYLFTGTTYVSGTEVEVSDGVTLTSNFPNNTLVFQAGSGEILNFTPGASSLTLESTGLTDTITLNRYGVRIASP